MADLLYLASLLPLLPILPLVILALALVGELAGEVATLLAPIEPVILATLAVPVAPAGPLVRFLQEERAERAILTARQRGDVALTIRASLALQSGDYGRVMALAGAACRIGR